MRKLPRVGSENLEDWSDDYVAEHAYLVARGVRVMAIVGHVPAAPPGPLTAVSRLERLSVGMPVVAFAVRRVDGFVDCGFAAARWAVDLYEWLVSSPDVPPQQAHRVRGLLLGYGAAAIRDHDERTAGRRFSSSPGPASRSRASCRRGRAGTRGTSE